jgi:predicted secreted protein
VIVSAVHWAVLLSAFLGFWFLSLFCLLPVGLGEVDPETGAPLSPMLWRKVQIATAIAAGLWVIFFIVLQTGWFDL